MLAVIDLWAALMVPLLFGDARGVAVRGAMTVIELEESSLFCNWGETARLLVEVSPVGVLIEDSIAGDVVRVDRRLDGRIDEPALERALRAFKRRPLFVDRSDLLLAPSAEGGVDFQDLVTTIDVAARVGLTLVDLTTAFDLDAWSQVDDRHSSWRPQSSRVVLEDCWRYAICGQRS